jgi:acyl carrier protein
LIRLNHVPANERYDFMYREIISEICMVSGVDANFIEPTTPFMSLGIDSHMGVMLRGRFEKKFSLSLPPTLIWTYPYMDVFVKYLLSALANEGIPDNTISEIQCLNDNYAASLSELSNEEKDRLLLETLSNLGYD